MIWLTIGLALVAIIVVLYNRLVRARNRVDTAWSDIDVQLQRRHDLVPRLVKAVDAYAKYEKATLEAVAELRAEAMRQTGIRERGRAEEKLGDGMHRLIALAESYPDLKANQNMMQLSEELTTTENKVAFARQAYNDSVMDYNTLRESFPNNLFAGWFNFRAAELLEIEDETKREVPKVSF